MHHCQTERWILQSIGKSLKHQAHTYVARISNLLLLPVPGVSHNQRLAFHIFHTQSPTKFGRSKCVSF